MFSRPSLRVRERRRLEQEARAQRIELAAGRVFARHGVDDATMEMIAREAKVAVGTIYLHFSSRDEVYLTLAVASGERLHNRFAQVKSRGLDPLEELRGLVRAYIEHFHDARDSYMLSSANVAQIRSRLRGTAEKRKFDRVTELRRELFGTMEATVRRACDAGLIANPFGPMTTTALVWSMMKGALELTTDSDFWRELTGMEARHLVEQIIESHLICAGKAAEATDRMLPSRANHRSARAKMAG